MSIIVFSMPHIIYSLKMQIQFNNFKIIIKERFMEDG